MMLLVHLAILIATGAIIYTGSSLLLWFAMKRPPGPETELQRMLGKILSKAKRVALPKSA
jgi:PST family polysaccharide transporter